MSHVQLPLNSAGLRALLLSAIVLCLTFGSATRADQKHLIDRSTAPSRALTDVEAVASFETPPGHVTVSRSGRIFMDAYIFDAAATFRVIELIDGKKVPFPDPSFQKQFTTIHGLYVDSKDRLWILDHGLYGFKHAPRLYGYDINTGREIVNYEFPSHVAGYGSMINDVLVDTAREKLYISDTGPINHRPGIIVFDIETTTSRRALDRHPTLTASEFPIVVAGRPFEVLFGIVKPKFGIDGIALDPSATWFYYSAFNRGELYRIPAAQLADVSVNDRILAASIEKVADTTMSDGMWADAQQNVYMTDVEHSAIMRVHPDAFVETVFKDMRFRWPASFAVSPDGWMYFTCDAINETVLENRKAIVGLGPYYLYRFKK